MTRHRSDMDCNQRQNRFYQDLTCLKPDPVIDDVYDMWDYKNSHRGVLDEIPHNASSESAADNWYTDDERLGGDPGRDEEDFKLHVQLGDGGMSQEAIDIVNAISGELSDMNIFESAEPNKSRIMKAFENKTAWNALIWSPRDEGGVIELAPGEEALVLTAKLPGQEAVIDFLALNLALKATTYTRTVITTDNKKLVIAFLYDVEE